MNQTCVVITAHFSGSVRTKLTIWWHRVRTSQNRRLEIAMPETHVPSFSSPVAEQMNKIYTNFVSASPMTAHIAGGQIAGKWQVEQQIVTHVASYGKQLGWIADIVLTLAQQNDLSSEAVGKLSRAVNRINQIKADHAKGAEDEARDALNRLKANNPGDFRRVMAEYWREIARLNAA